MNNQTFAIRLNLTLQSAFVKFFMPQNHSVNLVPDILIAMGANLPSVTGVPFETLRAAIKLMPTLGIEPIACSSFYSTPAIAPYVQAPYVNAVIAVASAHPAAELLRILHRLEEVFGRKRGQRWDSRTLDLDLLDCRGEVLPFPDHMFWGPAGGGGTRPLSLPHPLLAERAFVLVPLAEIAPQWRHPVTGELATELLERLGPKGRNGIKLLNH